MNLKAIFPTGITELTVNGLHQWDYGRKLEIHAQDLPAIVEVHFACPGMDEAVVRVGSVVDGSVTVAIPDRCLEQSAPITVWVFEVGETYGQTIKTLTLNIMARTRPQTTETIEPEMSDKFTEAIGALYEVLEALDEAVDDIENGNVTAKKATNAEKAKKGEAYYVSSIEGIENVAFSLRDGECAFVAVGAYDSINIRGVTVSPGACGTIFKPYETAPLLNLVDKNGNIYIGRIYDENWTVHDGYRGELIECTPSSVTGSDGRILAYIYGPGVYAVNLDIENSDLSGNRTYSTLTETIIIADTSKGIDSIRVGDGTKISMEYVAAIGSDYAGCIGATSLDVDKMSMRVCRISKF